MEKALSKSQIASVLAEKVGITKKQSVEYLEALAGLAYSNAKNTFTLPGLGKLKLRDRAARTGRATLRHPRVHDADDRESPVEDRHAGVPGPARRRC